MLILFFFLGTYFDNLRRKKAFSMEWFFSFYEKN